MKSLVVFGIDVSSRQSTVAVVINRAKLPEFKISNDLIGFKRALCQILLMTYQYDKLLTGFLLQ